MNESVVLVLNAGSSSLKFQLFAERRDRLDLLLRGQVESLHGAPRFVASSPEGHIVAEKRWRDGEQLGHEGAVDHLADFVRGESRRFTRTATA